MDDKAKMTESASVGVIQEHHDGLRWNCVTNLKKFNGDSTAPEDMYDEVTIQGNMLMYGGASNLWECLKGLGSSTPGNAKCYYDNTNAAIGVGDSTTAEAATHTDLQAATNKVRKGMDTTYPTHTDGVTNGSDDIVFRATFATGDANWAWQEWGIFNSPTAATGRMLNRKVESLGTKTSAATWQLTITLSLGSN